MEVAHVKEEHLEVDVIHSFGILEPVQPSKALDKKSLKS